MPKVTLIKPKPKDPVRHSVKTRLDDLNMSQSALSKVMGVSDASVSTWLSNPDKLTLGNLRKIGKALGMRVEIRMEVVQ